MEVYDNYDFIPSNELSRERASHWKEKFFYHSREEDDDYWEEEHPLDVAYEREQRKLAKHSHALWLKEEKEKCNWEQLEGYGLPLCGSHKAIAKLMGISVKKLRFLAFSRKTSHYIRFQLPKKTGGKRDISAPKPQLKQAQEWILHSILEKLELHNAAHGFCCGCSIVTNAQPHVGVFVQEQQIRETKYKLVDFDLKIEQAIAENSRLRNEQLRDAKRREWKNAEKYRIVVNQKEEAEDRLKILKIQLEQIKAQFEVEKLLLRERIASMEKC